MEESVNFVKGYGKVNPSDDDERTPVPCQSTSPKRRKMVIIVVTLGLFAIILGAIIGAVVVHHPRTKPSESQPSSVKATDTIKAVCAVTQHPDTCFTDISSIDSGNVVDPEMIFNLTLQLAFNELANISSFPKSLISKSHDLRSGPALRDCSTLFDDALSQLSRSAESMRVGTGAGGEKVLLTEGKVGDLKTWISAAMTDQETCLDGLEETGSTAVDEVRSRMRRSGEYMSNSLAILGNIETILDQFGIHMH